MNNFGSTLGHKTLICLLTVRYSNETKKPRTSYKHEQNNNRKFKATGGRGAFDASTKQTSFLRPLVEPAEAQQGHVPL